MPILFFNKDNLIHGLIKYISPKKWMGYVRNSFWTESASRRGFHRQLSHAMGVLALASKRWRRIPWADVRKDRQMCRSFLRAALFHDIGKAKENGETV